MKIGILGQRGGWHERSLQKGFERHGIQAQSFPITRLCASQGKPSNISVNQTILNDYDVLIVRAIPGGSLEEIIFRMDALHCLENQGVCIVNSPSAIERTVDKYYTLSLLENAGLPVPPSIVTQHFDEAMEGFDKLGRDMVIKPLFGSEGRGMVRVSDKDTAYRALRALELGRYIYCLQKFVPHKCEDIRSFVVGKRVIASMLRQSDSWKTNIAQGAEGKEIELDSCLEQMSLEAASILGTDYAGVDILPMEEGGHCLIEVNGIPAWRGLQSVTGVNAGELLVNFILNKYLQVKEKIVL